MMKKQLTIIIIHWNTPDLLKQQLKVLTAKKDFQVIVVDNNSDFSINDLEEKYKQVKFILNEKNHGFAYACNQGLKIAETKWLLFLNPDVAISIDQAEEMIKYAEKKNLVALSPSFKSDDYQKPIPSVFSLLAEFTPLKYLVPLSIFKHKTLVGGCLMIKKQALNKVDGWDTDFFLWFEDSDLSKRLIKDDYKIGFYPEAISHLGGEALKKLEEEEQRKIFFTSMQTYAKKHFSLFGQLIVKLLKKRYT